MRLSLVGMTHGLAIYKDTETAGPHFKCDVREVLNQGWDMMIGHPECTFLANASVRWLYNIPKKPKRGVLYGPPRWPAMRSAAEFFMLLWRANIPKVCLENPVMHHHAKDHASIPEWTQTIQPWQFGHGVVKRTCFWLRGLPELTPSNVVDGRYAECHRESPGKNRKRNRSRTYQGIADAMAQQWGGPGVFSEVDLFA